MLLATFSSVMLNIVYVILAIVVLLTMVLIHELGHYIAGRVLGFKITEFSIGFGKVLWQKTNKRGEKISLRLFPLGGFCAFLGETDDESTEKKSDNVIDITSENKDNSSVNITKTHCENCGFSFEGEYDKCPNCECEIKNLKQENKDNSTTLVESQEGRFNDQKPWKRIIVFLAGVTFNFLSAFIFSIIFLAVGGYDAHILSPTENYTVSLYNPNTDVVVSQLQKDTIVYAVDGVEINYARAKVFANIVSSDADSVILTIDGTSGEKIDVELKREIVDSEGNLIFGISYGNMNIDYSFLDVLRDFIPFTFHLAWLILQAFWQLITGQIALKNMGGPISTISQMTVFASHGLSSFLYLLPFLAANLAIFNILPIPGLDGAHVIFTTIEWIRKKPIKREIENAIHAWGIICLFAFVIIVDIIHLIAF